MRQQVPWGKHNPVAFRTKHEAKAASRGVTDQTTVFPIVLLKDPYTWMVSMCRHKYFASWGKSREHCPGLIRSTPDELKQGSRGDHLRVRMRYIPSNITYYNTLVELWNTWYNDWVYADFPRLIVRYEDVLFNPKYLTKTICHCAGGVMKQDKEFKHVVGAAKTMPIHRGSNGLEQALLRYGNSTVRKEQYVKEDIDYALQHLDPNLMKFFHYNYITNDE